MRSIAYILNCLLLLVACVDPVSIEIPSFQYQIVVDGFITTEPGPYTVKIYRSRPVAKADLDRLVPERNAVVRIKDDLGNMELLNETEDGVYTSHAGGIQGQIGRSYHVEIATADGKQYRSNPELISPVGEVTNISYRFVDYGIQGLLEEGDGFRIFVDATGVPGVKDQVRLKMVATYQVLTFPERNTKRDSNGNIIPDPFPCSGYVYENNWLMKVDECTCCNCWVSIYDQVPVITNEQFTSNEIFAGEEVGFVPASRRTLYDKIHVEIQQLSLTSEMYQFWKLVRAQKLGASNIFQPPSGKLVGNIKAINAAEEALGVFWAADVNKKSIFIDRHDMPFIPLPIDTLIVPCNTYFINSTNLKPDFWQ